MSDSPTDSSQPLQLERADFAQADPEGHVCRVCSTPLHDHYYEINGQATCERCRYEVEKSFQTRGGAGGFLKALALGLGGGLIGAGVYYAVLTLAHLEVGLISILVGWLVGKGVHKGSRGKGGWVYQTLAVGITYLCIVSTYIPMIIQGFREIEPKGKPAASAPAQAGSASSSASPDAKAVPVQTGAAASTKSTGGDGEEEDAPGAGDVVLAFGALLLIAAAAPFLQGAQNILGILIIGFGLYQAWQLNRRTELSIAGPFRVGSTPTSIGATGS
jgi:hypothetical protein